MVAHVSFDIGFELNNSFILEFIGVTELIFIKSYDMVILYGPYHSPIAIFRYEILITSKFTVRNCNRTC